MVGDELSDISQNFKHGPLTGLKVLDLSRILAGPTATQLLGDLGADVLKIERPELGDDTRGWGPPFAEGPDGKPTRESAYFLSSNRNKRSAALDMASEDGAALIRQLAAKADIVVENFKVGGLEKYGLDYASLQKLNERLIYCSITGFGQTGPLSHRAGYDFMIQGFGGIMSLTGFPDEAQGEPTKTGVAIADVMCGMYATVAVLGALHSRTKTGQGQHIDLALFDTQLAWLINQGAAFLMTGQVPPRRGNDHPSIVPYGTFPAADKAFIIACGNDGQFQRLCAVLGNAALAHDRRFKTNAGRVENRDALKRAMRQLTIMHDADHWLAALEAVGVPAGPIQDMGEAFAHPQAKAREMIVEMPHAASASGVARLIANPIRYSHTPVSYRYAPPQLGEGQDDALAEWLNG